MKGWGLTLASKQVTETVKALDSRTADRRTFRPLIWAGWGNSGATLFWHLFEEVGFMVSVAREGGKRVPKLGVQPTEARASHNDKSRTIIIRQAKAYASNNEHRLTDAHPHAVDTLHTHSTRRHKNFNQLVHTDRSPPHCPISVLSQRAITKKENNIFAGSTEIGLNNESGSMFFHPRFDKIVSRKKKGVKAKAMLTHEVFLERKPPVPNRGNSRASLKQVFVVQAKSQNRLVGLSGMCRQRAL